MPFDTPLAGEIWRSKYQLKSPSEPGEETVEDTWRRVSRAVASVEAPDKRERWEGRFYEALEDFRFIPAGRILAGAGTGRAVTLFNCFVMGAIPDSLEGIFAHLREAAVTMQQGGGVGMDFSTIRPAGAEVRGVGAQASGPLSFMDTWDAMCRTIMSAGQRRGAMMGCLRIDHPDIEAFIDAKKDPARLRNFNLSVLVTDAFMAAMKADDDWPLSFAGERFRTVRARALWEQLMQAAYDAAEPGVIFIDRVNAQNNLAHCETISASNPCGEQMLPPYGACLLGSINLAKLVESPFERGARLDLQALGDLTRTAVRFLDNVIDLSRYPLAQQEREAKSKRRIGLGVTGLADALIGCGVKYGSLDAEACVLSWLGAMKQEAYRASAELAAEKGAFDLYDPVMLDRPNLQGLNGDVRTLIARHGLRNGCLTSIAPTGTTSLLAGNVSSGVEPVFAFSYTRKIREADGSPREEAVEDFALAQWRRLKGDAPRPDSFVSAQTLEPGDHVRMQAAAQTCIDSSISKTVNCPEDIDFEAFSGVYEEGFRTGCKGMTTYRPNAVTGSVLSATPAEHFDAPPLAPRPESLSGATYKIKWPLSDHATYVTINEIEDGQGRRPFEIFVNSKNPEHHAWTVALTRMISAVFRRGGDVSFVAEELQAVFDPVGGAWMSGRYVPSLPAAIGGIIGGHLAGEADDPVTPVAPESALSAPRRPCSRCGGANVVRKEGCDACLDCGHSKCG